MTQASIATEEKIIAKDRLIVALDVASADAARDIVAELGSVVGAFKIGLQLFAAAGPDLVREFTAAGHRIFLDLKFHDIPNTVAHASVEAARLGVWMFNIHALGGREMMEQTVEAVHTACQNESISRPLIIGVTVLTSSDEGTMREVGVETDAGAQVTRLASLAAESGLDGVVASGLDAALVRRNVSVPGFVIVTPGIRPISATHDDQKRVTTFAQAVASGSDYVVIGRPITAAGNRTEAVKSLISEI